MSETNEKNFVVVDLETSGLARVDVILEVGIKVYDRNWNSLGAMQQLVISPGWRPLLARNSYVWDMHAKSGLMKDLEYIEHSGNAAMHTPKKVEYEFLQFLQETMGLKSGQNPITGSSVEFDRRFLREHMPLLEAWFHYRSVDVSTVKELCKRRNPSVSAALKGKPWADESSKKHRVLDDIDFTVAELRFYEENFFVNNFEADLPGADQPVLPGL